MSADVARFEPELLQDSELVEHILRLLLPAPASGERVLIKADAASVDAAICKALVLAVEGVESRIELIKQ
jgi:hypothetical protein